MHHVRPFTGKAKRFGGAVLVAALLTCLTTAAAQTTLEYWAWVEGSEEAVALWNETHPDVQVNFTRSTAGTEHYNKVKTAVAAGSGGPDVAQVEFQLLTSMVVTGAVQPITAQAAAAGGPRDGAIGAVAGAMVGVAASHRKDRLRGGLLGAVAGGALGAVFGHSVDRTP